MLSHDRDQKRIVWLGSKVLTPAEQRYSNIEREALAIVAAVKYFHIFVAGRDFTIISDQQPLKFIFQTGKDLNSRVSARLQRWQLVLRAYDYNIIHKPGKEIFLPDTLSRLTSTSKTVKSISRSLVNFSDMDNVINTSLMDEIKSVQDPVMDKLKKYILKGKWPDYDKKLLPYKRNVEEYTIQNGIVYRGLRVVIPKCLQHRTLKLLHHHHPGVVRMRRLARQHCWWPSIDQQINDYCSHCLTCKKNVSRPYNSSLFSWSETSRPFERVHCDIGFIDKQQFLIYVDSYSCWLDVQPLKNLKSTTLIDSFRDIFKYVGIPDSIVTDNGSNFVSDEMSKFFNSNYIKHFKTPAYHHQSNGLAERYIQHLKLFLRKNSFSLLLQSLSNFCLTHNTTPLSASIAPADIIFSFSVMNVVKKQFHSTVISEPYFYRWGEKGNEKVKLDHLHHLGSNTSVTDEMKLVHDAQKLLPMNSQNSPSSSGIQLPQQQQNLEQQQQQNLEQPVQQQYQQIQHDIIPAPQQPEVPEDIDPDLRQPEQVLRRSTRVKKKPQRYIEECE